jgi:oxygen-independent coproporphyrinogen-3 oxidase
LEEATRHFDNISVDLIYGVPGMSNEKWQNIEKALSFGIPHISSCFDGGAQNGFEKIN